MCAFVKNYGVAYLCGKVPDRVWDQGWSLKLHVGGLSGSNLYFLRV